MSETKTKQQYVSPSIQVMQIEGAPLLAALSEDNSKEPQSGVQNGSTVNNVYYETESLSKQSDSGSLWDYDE